MLNKKIIQQHFSRTANDYGKFALVQKHVANQTSLLASAFLYSDAKILDLGSGCGFVADSIATIKNLNNSNTIGPVMRLADNPSWNSPSKIIPPSHDKAHGHQQQNFSIYELDLSFQMLQNRNNPTIQCDIENLCFKAASFDLVISSFALQWIINLEKTFNEIYQILKPNSFFIFSIPTYESLTELRLASVKSGCNFYFNDLPKTSELKFHLEKAGFNLRNIKQETIKQEFTSAVLALKSIKKIGANYSENKKNISKLELKKFDNIFLSNFTSRPYISWTVDYFILQKHV